MYYFYRYKYLRFIIISDSRGLISDSTVCTVFLSPVRGS